MPPPGYPGSGNRAGFRDSPRSLPLFICRLYAGIPAVRTPRDAAGRSPDPHTEALPASGTADGMLACLARQTQYRAAGGAGTEHVRFRVCRTRRAFTVTEGGLHLAQETEPCGVLTLTGGDIPRQEAADRPDHCPDRQHVQYRARNAEAGQGRACSDNA